MLVGVFMSKTLDDVLRRNIWYIILESCGSGLETVGALKMQDWKMQDWKMTDLNLPTELVVVVDCAANFLKCLQHVSRW